jgi:Ca2+-binding EF-hand superfamily protein
VSPATPQVTDEDRARVFSVIDADGDGRIERQVYLDYYAAVFLRLDKNGNVRLDPAEFARPTVRAAADADGDGSLTPAEFGTIFERQFSALDSDADGVVTKAEMLGQGD